VPNGAKKREKGGKGGDEKNALLIGLLTEVEQILTAPQKDKKKNFAETLSVPRTTFLRRLKNGTRPETDQGTRSPPNRPYLQC
jgi:hypothetical protein